MQKNYIQSHFKLFVILCLFFILLPTFKNTFAMEKTGQGKLTHRIFQQEKVEETSLGHVVLDAGHGGYDSGSVSKGQMEKDITLAIVLKVADYLEEEGVQVTLTRDSDDVSWPSDNVEDLAARSNIANTSNADAFISLHTNTYLDDTIYGSEIWLNYENSQNVALAQCMQEALIKAEYTYDRGLKDQAESPLQLLVYNQIPSILLEVGFLTNDHDFEVLTTKEGQETIAKAITEGIINYLKNLHKS